MFADDTLVKDRYRGLQEKLLCLLFLWISRFNNLAFATFFFFLICTPTSKSCLEDNDRVPLREVQAVFPNLQVDSQDVTAANQTSWCGGGWNELGGAWKTMVDFLWQPSKQFFQILTVKYQDAATVKSETRFQAEVLQAGSRAWRWLERTWRWLEDNDWQPLTGSPRALLPTPLPPETMRWCTMHNALMHNSLMHNTLSTMHCAQYTEYYTLSTMNPAQCPDARCTDALLHDSLYTPLRPETMHSAH